MLDQIPDDLVKIIINKSCENPKDYIYFKNINKRCLNIINSFENLYLNKENTYENEINELCNKYTSLKDFHWLFKNNVKFTLLNIKHLIINNRIDVIQRGFYYSYFLDIIFNQFYIGSIIQNFDVFSLVESSNPLIIAASYNRVEIIKLLIEKSTIGNPYIRQIPELLDLAIKYNHKKLLSYLIINHLEVIKPDIDSKLLPIIYRINNCEDIIFHLYINDHITLSSKHIQGIITKHYNQFFQYCYQKTNNHHDPFNLLSLCISCNNIELFNFIFQQNENKISKRGFTELLFENKKEDFYFDRPEFLNNLINNYRDSISIKSNFLSTCISSKIEESTIIELIDIGFEYTTNDMKIILENNYIHALQRMCEIINATTY